MVPANGRFTDLGGRRADSGGVRRQAARQRRGVEHHHLDQRRPDHRRAHDVVAGPGGDGRDFWTEAHNSPGATATGTRWALAEGEVGGPQSAETYILIANTSTIGGAGPGARCTSRTARAAERHVRRCRRGAGRTSACRPSSRRPRAGASAQLVESLGATPAQIVVERAMYTSPGGVDLGGGHQRARHARALVQQRHRRLPAPATNPHRNV